MSEGVVAQLDNLLQRLEVLRDLAERDAEITRLRARVEVLEQFRSSSFLRLEPYLDGDKWCVLYGPNIQDGVSGFGDTPEEARDAFDAAWPKALRGFGERVETDKRDAEIARLRADRRERVATACLAGILADPTRKKGKYDDYEQAEEAVRYADSLIHKLGWRAKPRAKP